MSCNNRPWIILAIGLVVLILGLAGTARLAYADPAECVPTVEVVKHFSDIPGGVTAYPFEGARAQALMDLVQEKWPQAVEDYAEWKVQVDKAILMIPNQTEIVLNGAQVRLTAVMILWGKGDCTYFKSMYLRADLLEAMAQAGQTY